MSGSRFVDLPDECGRCGGVEDVERVGCRVLCRECRDEQRDAAHGPL
jgi:hypothetical protein